MLSRDQAPCFPAIKRGAFRAKTQHGVEDADLAARLGLSVVPVRADLARLADEGLVEAKPQSHTRVTPLVVRQVRDAAVATGDVDTAVAADDDLHGVLLARCGNAALTATVELFTPAIRRLERQRFAAPAGHPSVAPARPPDRRLRAPRRRRRRRHHDRDLDGAAVRTGGGPR